MARVFANDSINMGLLNLNGLLGYTYQDFYSDVNQVYNGITYQDIVEFSDYIGNNQYDAELFGGTNITINASGAVTGGTVTGYLKAITSTAGIVSASWGVESFSYSAKALSDAALTVSTADDSDIFSSILSGADSFSLSAYADTARGFGGNDTMLGYGGNDQLQGDAGNDILDGGAGSDAMLGGAGSDTYFVDNSGDRVYETVTSSATSGDAGGTDTVKSAITLNLNAYAGIQRVEKLILTGTGNTSGTGNSLANTMTGNSGANTLNGGSGNDIISGGLGNDTLIGATGNDTLTGGSGLDKFRFNTALNNNVDTIKAFVTADDTIQLDDAIFTAAGAVGNLAANAFTTGTAAHDANDRIIFNSTTGALLYDADGSGGGAAIQFATLSGITGTLSASDFVIL